MQTTDSAGSLLRAAWQKLLLGALFTSYFLYFNWGSLRVQFALDDLGNIGHYYELSPWQMLLANFTPWRGDVRPMGGLFYMPIYQFAGLSPVPYQAVLLLLLLANVYLVYRFAILLDAGKLAAVLIATVFCYHGGIANLYYNAAFVFDVLCCLFYLAAFVYYLRIRTRGQLLGPWQTAAFLGLFLCALNSKEMAVSIPVMLLLYEWIYHRPTSWSGASPMAWVRGPARVSLIAAALDLVDIYGKVAGPRAMIHDETYHPVFSLDRIRDFHHVALRDLFYSWAWTPGWKEILTLWAILAILAFRPGAGPILRFLFWFLVVVPLPIEFLVGKSQACLTLLMIGGALFVAVVFADLVDSIARFFARGFRLPPVGRRAIAAAMVAPAVFLWVRDQQRLRVAIGGDPMTTLGFETTDLIAQMRTADFHARPNSRVVFLNDPFHSLDMYFLASLWVHDRSVTVHAPCQGALPPQELAKADYVFSIENRRLIRLK